mmetsp:Transcript_26761/g.50333  ORF Transcript_26761/g.50333 Transcript_26761/m.50333 type:complete len:95 (-) Transcript_26761:493-777(-)
MTHQSSHATTPKPNGKQCAEREHAGGELQLERMWACRFVCSIMNLRQPPSAKQVHSYLGIRGDERSQDSLWSGQATRLGTDSKREASDKRNQTA